MTQARYGSLRDQQHPVIRQLADIIETLWRGQLVTYAYDTPTDLGHVEGLLEGERLTIENHCYQTPQFRKLHLELAKVGKNLDILHCVMFPKVNFDLPIFGVDIVAGPGGISAAIVDLSPVSANRSLPTLYREALEDLPSVVFSQPRTLPDWGDIFSKFCLFVRPTTPEEAIRFLDQVTQYLSIHCQLASSAVPIQSIEEYESILAGQHRYCSQQQQNDKTRRILERAFGAEWADRYLQTMLFDCVDTTNHDANVTVGNALSV
ncbi:MAG: phycocyanobilin:ferredoxin oxidoreductase [Cyanobacteria bacterium]|nr:phycocyanobilin:ferredoxin oxidoreductase [Cyanobacteriota bacterium]MDA0864830.1 phycocyanobilin:ferredoxin oxidoreductase [Cyanobacteriota bacterium]